MPPVLVCSPWLDVADVTLCAEADFTAGQLAKAVDAATDLLYLALGRSIDGPCIDVVRPCGATGRGQWLDYPSDSIGGARPIGIECACRPDLGWCSCSGHASIRLPNGPVVAVSQVRVGGVVVDPADYALVDDLFLVRRDGSWPCCQRPDPATEAGTFEVTYTWGTELSPSVLMAVEVLACELAKGWTNQACRLPKRLTSLVRENVQMTVLDPFDFLDEGRFGLYEVDEVVRMFNPHGIDRPPKVLTPESVAGRTRRLR